MYVRCLLKIISPTMPKVADLETINDMEHPDFVDSSLSENDSVNNSANAETLPFCSENNPLRVVPNTLIPCRVPPPPSVEFLKQTLSKIDPPKNKLSFMELKESHRLKATQNAKEEHAYRKRVIKEQEERDATVIALKNSIHNMQVNKLKLIDELKQINPSFEENMRKVNKQLVTAERKFSKSENKLKNKISELEKLNFRRENANHVFKKIQQEDGQFCKWLTDHSISVFVRNEKSITTNAESREAETVLLLKNVNPKNPEEICHIVFESVTADQRKFVVQNVFPEFNEAYLLVERANESLDLKQLLLDCVKYWRQIYEQLSPNKSIDSIKSGNSSMELF